MGEAGVVILEKAGAREQESRGIFLKGKRRWNAQGSSRGEGIKRTDMNRYGLTEGRESLI